MISRWLRIVMLLMCVGALLFVYLRVAVNSTPSERERAVSSSSGAILLVSPYPEGVTYKDTPAQGGKLQDDDDELDGDDEVESASSVSAKLTDPTTMPMARPSASARKQGEPIEGKERLSEAFSDDDARSIFSPLQQDGSKVTNDQFFSGVRVGGAVGAAAAPEPTKEPEEGLPWVEGQSRGYTMLYAMQTAARDVVERNVQALLASHIKDVHIGVLIDGTFGQDFEYLRTVITRLSSNGRRLTLALYLSNGPTMRKWDTTPIDALFTRIDPREFRSRIIREQALQSQFVEVARNAKSVFAFNRSLSDYNVNVAIPMLEDNLDRNAYRVMRDLARNEIRDNCVFMRNPCVGCFPGNDGDSLGDPREEHTVNLFASLKPGDSFSLDGIGFVYPGMQRTIELSADELLNLMSSAYGKGLRYVGLWRHDWQGVEHGVANGHPESRAYVSSNEDQLSFEIEALRHSLSPVETSEEDLDN